MTPRTTMFIVLCCAALVIGCPMLAPAQAPDRCVQNADGTWTCPGLNGTTITCPILAPPLPAALAAEAAAASVQEPAIAPAADRLTLRQRREMGFTRLAVIRATTRLAREGRLPSTRGLAGDELAAVQDEIKDAVAAEILGENIQAWSGNIQDGNDWGAFFEQLIAFLEKLMPLILQLIEIFGGLSQVTPTAAGMMAHASPMLFLAV